MRMRLRFSLRYFLIVFTIVAILFGGAAHFVFREKDKVRRHKFAIEKLQESGIVFETYSLAEPQIEGENAWRRLVRLNIDQDAYPRVGRVALDFTPRAEMRITLSEAIKHLGDVQCVTELSLEDIRLTKQAVKGLARLPDLVSLDLSLDSIDADAAQALRDLRSLEKLQIGGRVSRIDYQEHGRISDKALTAIATLPRLKELSLLGTGFSEDGLSSIGKIRTLEILELRQVQVSPIWLEALRNAKRLRWLKLRSGDFQPGGSAALGKLASLTTLEIDGAKNLPEDLFHDIAQLSNLEEFALSGEPLSNSDQIRQLLACKRLSLLNLSQTTITKEDLLAFGDLKWLVDFTFVGDLPKGSIQQFLQKKSPRWAKQLSKPNSREGMFFSMQDDELYSHTLPGGFGGVF